MARTAEVPQEVELKFEVDPASLTSLRSHPLLRPRPGTRRTTHDLVSTYFDSADLDLMKRGVSLRIRRDGARRVQTIKAGSSGEGGFARGEWERVIGSDVPDVSQVDDTPLADLADVVAGAGPRFKVHVTRVVAESSFGESLIEVAMDQGAIEGGEGGTTFAEIELELKHGALRDAFALALELVKDAPLRLSFRTKAERGFAALTARDAHRVKAEPVNLRRGISCAQAFQAIGLGCLRHLMANETLFREAPHPEALHQMRVALRRFRAAIGLFKDVVGDDQRIPVSQELKWMAGELGKARDLDVYIAEVLEPAQARHDGDPAISTLLATYRHRRDRTYEDVEQMIRSTRFLSGVIAAAAWIETGDWVSSTRKSARKRRREPVEDLAGVKLARLRKRIRKGGKHLDRLSPEERHEVRIDIKKLRYASEFFAGLYRRKRARREQKSMAEVLEALQELLGHLNDIAVGGGMEGTDAAEAIHREQLGRVPDLLKDAKARYRTFVSLDPFWSDEFAGKRRAGS